MDNVKYHSSNTWRFFYIRKENNLSSTTPNKDKFQLNSVKQLKVEWGTIGGEITWLSRWCWTVFPSLHHYWPCQWVHHLEDTGSLLQYKGFRDFALSWGLQEEVELLCLGNVLPLNFFKDFGLLVGESKSSDYRQMISKIPQSWMVAKIILFSYVKESNRFICEESRLSSDSSNVAKYLSWAWFRRNILFWNSSNHVFNQEIELQCLGWHFFSLAKLVSRAIAATFPISLAQG